MNPLPDSPSALSSQGYCRDCDVTHSLGEGRARIHARKVMDRFQEARRLDYHQDAASADPRLGEKALWLDEVGQMYGVLECTDPRGRTVVLRAFSSLPGGIRHVSGWVPPLLDRETHEALVLSEERRIKSVTRRMETLDPRGSRHSELATLRQELSRRLMAAIHDHYPLHNFQGKTRSLREAFDPSLGIPGGVGECCAPKLLSHAARNGLRPRGLVEFFWGGTNPSGGRRPGEFYSPCESRCRPILGFLLCGIEA